MCRTRASLERSRSAAMGTSVVGNLLAGEELFDEAEAAHVGHPLRIKNAVQVIALVLHHARMEALGHAIDGIALLVEARVAKLRVAGHDAAHAGHREAALPPFLHL